MNVCVMPLSNKDGGRWVGKALRAFTVMEFTIATQDHGLVIESILVGGEEQMMGPVTWNTFAFFQAIAGNVRYMFPTLLPGTVVEVVLSGPAQSVVFSGNPL